MIAIRCSALLFDLDGVLIDSTPAVSRVWHRWAVEHGLDPETVVRMAHGRPSRTTIRELLPDADIDHEDREVERREIADLDGVVLLPGARELLNILPPERWTIATSCTRPLAEVRLRAAGLPIPKTMITSSDVKIGKPDPEPYVKAAAKLGFAACRLHRGGRCACRNSRRKGCGRRRDCILDDDGPPRPRRCRRRLDRAELR